MDVNTMLCCGLNCLNSRSRFQLDPTAQVAPNPSPYPLSLSVTLSHHRQGHHANRQNSIHLHHLPPRYVSSTDDFSSTTICHASIYGMYCFSWIWAWIQSHRLEGCVVQPKPARSKIESWSLLARFRKCQNDSPRNLSHETLRISPSRSSRNLIPLEGRGFGDALLAFLAQPSLDMRLAYLPSYRYSSAQSWWIAARDSIKVGHVNLLAQTWSRFCE
ncbi:hypothetical protein F5X99DRAFT_372954 [Biscogniauxia marginata]|nr:hypothetical protein F5X99DRAFT_372954 [Biscogniauxia marginata]